MPVKITNVSQDHAYAMKRRTAARLQMEPVIAGERLRLRSSRVLTDEQVKANVEWLAENERGGVITIEPMGDTPLDVLLPASPPEPVAPLEPEPPAPELPPLEEVFPPAPPAPPAPPESVPLASSETASSTAPTQPLPVSRKDDKKRR